MILTDKQEKVLAFVKEAHDGIVRKYTGEPYWTHPYEVADMLYPAGFGIIEIALMHDVIEDTDYDDSYILHLLLRIGYSKAEASYIVAGVVALTDVYTKEKYISLNRAKRKKLESVRLGTIHNAFQNVKYVDLIHNTESIVKNDKGFAKVYLNEKRDILLAMDRGHKDLRAWCFNVLMAAEIELNIDSTEYEKLFKKSFHG